MRAGAGPAVDFDTERFCEKCVCPAGEERESVGRTDTAQDESPWKRVGAICVLPKEAAPAMIAMIGLVLVDLWSDLAPRNRT